MKQQAQAHATPESFRNAGKAEGRKKRPQKRQTKASSDLKTKAGKEEKKEKVKKYQLWTKDSNGYSLEEFDTLKECFEAPKYTNVWKITKTVVVRFLDEEVWNF